VHRVNERLGSGLARLFNITDADRIVLGNTLARLYEMDPDPVTEQSTTRSFLSHASEIPILPGILQDGALPGAAEIAFQPCRTTPSKYWTRSAVETRTAGGTPTEILALSSHFLTQGLDAGSGIR
jgi:hypothetical protein